MRLRREQEVEEADLAAAIAESLKLCSSLAPTTAPALLKLCSSAALAPTTATAVASSHTPPSEGGAIRSGAGESGAGRTSITALLPTPASDAKTALGAPPPSASASIISAATSAATVLSVCLAPTADSTDTSTTAIAFTTAIACARASSAPHDVGAPSQAPPTLSSAAPDPNPSSTPVAVPSHSLERAAPRPAKAQSKAAPHATQKEARAAEGRQQEGRQQGWVDAKRSGRRDGRGSKRGSEHDAPHLAARSALTSPTGVPTSVPAKRRAPEGASVAAGSSAAAEAAVSVVPPTDLEMGSMQKSDVGEIEVLAATEMSSLELPEGTAEDSMCAGQSEQTEGHGTVEPVPCEVTTGGVHAQHVRDVLQLPRAQVRACPTLS